MPPMGENRGRLLTIEGMACVIGTLPNITEEFHMARNWEAIGLSWLAEDVSKVFGENNASDKRVVATAQLPVVTDLDKLAAGGVDILAWLNASNSMRVRAQAIARKNPKADPEKMRELVFSALQGVRMGVAGRTVEIIKRALPDGNFYTGTDENEYRSQYAAALVDKGVDSDVALTIATTVAF